MRIRKNEIDISIISVPVQVRRFDPQTFKVSPRQEEVLPEENRDRTSCERADRSVGEVEIIKPVDEGFFDDFPSFFHRHERSGSALGVQTRYVWFFSLAVGICHCNALPSSSALNVQNNRLFPKIPREGQATGRYE
jgi:hypothetical protein